MRKHCQEIRPVIAAVAILAMALGTAARAWAGNVCGPAGVSVEGCTALIASGRYSGVNLAKLYSNRGAAYNDKGEYDLAIADFDRAIRIDPNLAMAYNNRGAIYNGKGEYDLALADFDRAIRIDPNLAIAYSNRAFDYEQKGEYPLAISDYDQYLRLDPNDAVGYNSRCWDRALLGRNLPLALADCTRSLQLRPGSADTLDSRGFVQLKMGKYTGAIADYDAALKINPRLASSLYGRGFAERMLGRAIASGADVAAAEAIDPKIAGEFKKWGLAMPGNVLRSAKPRAAALEFHLVDEQGNPAQAKQSGQVPPGDQLYQAPDGSPVLLKREAVVASNDIERVRVTTVQHQLAVDFDFDARGAASMLSTTRANIGHELAVVYDGHVIQQGMILEPIGRQFQLTGLTAAQAHTFARIGRVIRWPPRDPTGAGCE